MYNHFPASSFPAWIAERDPNLVTLISNAIEEATRMNNFKVSPRLLEHWNLLGSDMPEAVFVVSSPDNDSDEFRIKNRDMTMFNTMFNTNTLAWSDEFYDILCENKTIFLPNSWNCTSDNGKLNPWSSVNFLIVSFIIRNNPDCHFFVLGFSPRQCFPQFSQAHKAYSITSRPSASSYTPKDMVAFLEREHRKQDELEERKLHAAAKKTMDSEYSKIVRFSKHYITAYSKKKPNLERIETYRNNIVSSHALYVESAGILSVEIDENLHDIESYIASLHH